ncbi:MAG: hypothetical protein KGZ61_07490 [Sandarakinorhabdus sp.]|nr:hypothetical protein [Sandarakinorhabdus sp.]
MRLLFAAAVAAAPLLLGGTGADARPVSFPGGITVMQELDPMMGSLLVHYTPNRHYSIGGRVQRMRKDEWTMAGAQATWLVKRWNMPEAQANLYVAGVAGGAWRDGETVHPGGFVEAQADWENRRVMVMGMARLTHVEGGAGNIGTSDMQMARFGWAPYAGDFGDVHLWLFAQVRRTSGEPDEVVPAAVARIFYRTMLFEAGVTDRGGLILNSVFRF